MPAITTRHTLVTRMISRRSTRSATSPANGPASRNGAIRAVLTRETRNGESVIWTTTHERMAMSIHWARKSMHEADQSRR